MTRKVHHDLNLKISKNFISHHDVSNRWNRNLYRPMMDLAETIIGTDLRITNSAPVVPPETFLPAIYA
jgi:hypothetical protein